MATLVKQYIEYDMGNVSRQQIDNYRAERDKEYSTIANLSLWHRLALPREQPRGLVANMSWGLKQAWYSLLGLFY